MHEGEKKNRPNCARVREVRISDKLKTAVAEHNVLSIRSVLVSALTTDRTGRSAYPAHLKYCLDHGISESEIFEKYDGKPLPQEPTDENFAMLWTGLTNNFAKERVEARIAMGRIRYPEEGLRYLHGTGDESSKKAEDRPGANGSTGNAVMIAVGIGAVILILGLGIKVLTGMLR